MLTTGKLFQSNMVIQREKSFVIWGEAGIGARVQVSVQGHSVSVNADNVGHWQAVLPALDTSDKEVLEITSGNERLEINDIAVGEVWIAGGQSNMEFYLRYEKYFRQGNQCCTNSRIRFLDVPKVAYDGQRSQFDYSRMGIWRKAVPGEVDYFSAVGFYFARAIEMSLDVPVGIIGCNWGGTVCAAWMEPNSVRQACPEWIEEYERFVATNNMDEYWENQKNCPVNDRGNPFASPYNEFMLPETHSMQELIEHLSMLVGGNVQLENNFLCYNIPGCLYEHMVKAIAPYRIRGVLWYQGESDDMPGRAEKYGQLLTQLIGDWRSLWKEELPFLIVQLPGFEQWLDVECSEFALIREAQENVTADVPNTWLCSISDAGEQYDIHPKNKLVVGERLALLARGHIYGEDILCDAPTAKELNWKENQLVVSFNHLEGGLIIDGDEIKPLMVLADGKQVEYNAWVDNEKLILVLESGRFHKIELRFAKERFYQVNLYNRAGIPALPFSMSCYID